MCTPVPSKGGWLGPEVRRTYEFLPQTAEQAKTAKLPPSNGSVIGQLCSKRQKYDPINAVMDERMCVRQSNSWVTAPL